MGAGINDDWNLDCSIDNLSNLAALFPIWAHRMVVAVVDVLEVAANDFRFQNINDNI